MTEFANFKTQPVSTQVALNEMAKFRCIVTKDARSLQWLLNNVSAGNLIGVTEEETNTLDSSLCINASTADSDGKVIYNNSNVTCVAINVNTAIAGISETATLQIQGNFTLIPSLVSHQCKANCIFMT